MTTTMALHRLLLRVSGQAPDGMIVLARRWLGAGWRVGVAKVLTFAACAGDFDVTDEEADLLITVLAEAGEDDSHLVSLPRTGTSASPPYRTSGRRFEAGDDESDQIDLIDRAAVDAAGVVQGVAGLWRAWRMPARPGSYPPPKRIYLVQARTDAPGVAAAVQDAIAVAGEVHPMVEVFDVPQTLPELTRQALSRAELLWADRPARPVRLAAAFDTYHLDGTPAFAQDRPRLTEPEAAWVSGYLAAGVPLLSSPDLAPDVLDPQQALRVPTGLRGDGRWVWSDATGYYLTTYGIAPDPDLLMAIRAAGYHPPEADAVAVHQARAGLVAAVEERSPAGGGR